MAVSTAATIADLQKEEQKEILKKGTKEATKAAKNIKETKKATKETTVATGEPKGDELITVKRHIATTLDEIREMALADEDVTKLQSLLKGLSLLQKTLQKTKLKAVSGS